jgi:hypothetical protein
MEEKWGGCEVSAAALFICPVESGMLAFIGYFAQSFRAIW